MSFVNKTVIITGANSGVGKDAAIMFAQAGANVIGVARRADKLEEVAQIVKSHEGKIENLGTFTSFSADVTNPDEVQKLFDTAMEKFGSVDVLVNNAGKLDAQTPVGNMTDELWYSVLALNLTAPMQTMRLAVNIMKEQENGGCIVNVGSLASVVGGSGGSAYTASKHGLLGLTKNTAIMYRNAGIRCNMICPGGMPTPLAIEGAKGFDQEGYKTIEPGMGRMQGMMPASDAASAIVFLASDAAKGINGVALPVDLGFTAF